MYCTIFVIFQTFLSLSTTQISDNACEPGSFCTYKCHCQNSCRGSDGLCGSNSNCDNGWFGLRCQYKDLVTTAGATIRTSESINNIAWITDRNDKTCIRSKNLRSVTVTWNTAYPLTWLRVAMIDTANLWTLKVSYIKEGQSAVIECDNTSIYQKGSQTIDIRCNNNVIITSLTLSGNLTSLCSLYVSGGRQIAFEQIATLSSVYGENGISYGAEKIVDGNNSTNAVYCGLTNNDTIAQLNVILQSHYIVNRFVIFNRGDQYNIARLKGFLLQTFNGQNLVMEYKDSESTAKVVYYINNITTQPVNKISISIVMNYLTICELEAFGECPAGKWSLPCTQSCPSSCPLTCHIDDGQCSSVCFGFSDPPYCTQACTSGLWGINCKEQCSSKCVSSSCNNQNGLCDQGCLGYSDFPICNSACSEGTWGVNCSQSCSSQCKNIICNSVDGTCDGGCKDGYLPPDCTQACNPGFYGVDCKEKCSKYCVSGKCESVFGNCVEGCQAGFKLPRCSQACDVGKHGNNCSHNCSSNCLNGTCDVVSGHCSLCPSGYGGHTCQEKQKSTQVCHYLTFEGGYGVGAATVIVLVVVAFTIYYRRWRCVNKSYKTNIYQTPNKADSDEHPYTQAESLPMASDYETISK